MAFKLKLGQMAKDNITGFEGVVVARTEWLNGCKRYGLQSAEMKDGKPIDEVWFDEQQLVKVRKKSPVERDGKERGGPRRDPSRPGA